MAGAPAAPACSQLATSYVTCVQAGLDNFGYVGTRAFLKGRESLPWVQQLGTAVA